ncbi:uncharacterized protein Bfra_000114 [Botrytis fragariae]|uniref:BTB domain-containing protein n=1 Tax=Botrytis fragariae TaxID=1964551 RepID=A0A8H6EMV2_9HELO|nr:uncharacterized protein Bfra_000114 [Botrytis fragariae]KAF5877949.1 hypothetical protein Bfra_000114 [Botrytis fragariae]
MPASFQDILNSRLFKFVVGEKVDGHATEFFVHEEAIVQLSNPLEALMRGGMTESRAACTVWDDVSKETFERFVQFAYTGDYTLPAPKMREWNRSDNCEELELTSKKEKKKKKLNDQVKSALTVALASSKLDAKVEEFLSPQRVRYPELTLFKFSVDFECLTFPLLASRNNYDHTCEPRGWVDSGKNYSNVFIGHAALYILGDFRLIDTLKALALYKLHKTLCAFELNSETFHDVIHLVRYVYAEEGGEEGCGDEIGALRSLVCHYMAMHAHDLSCENKFMELLGEGGQFVKDFFEFEVQRKR